MRVSLVVPSFYPATIYGGPIFSTLHTCEALAKLDDMEIYVSTTNTNQTHRLDVGTNKWLEFEDDFHVKYYNETIVDKVSISLIFKLWNDIRQASLVFIQGVFNVSTPVAIIYSYLLKKPLLLSPRGSLSNWGLSQGHWLKGSWLKLFIKPFQKHINWHATSIEEKKDIVSQFADATVYLVTNGIDVASYSDVKMLTNADYSFRFVSKKLTPSKIIVSMGRLHKVKGFDILINSFKNILNDYEDAILLIAGRDVGELKKLELIVSELNLSNCVYFIGEISGQDKVDFLGNADLFVLPSHTENFGNVYLESLAAGTPIVASLGTPWQNVEEAGCGKWVENNVVNTSEAMLELLKSDRYDLRIEAQNYAKLYDWKKIAFEFSGIFHSLTAKK